MNLLYIKYAVEIATCGSLNKAAEKLYVGQPNLSRAIKELESSLGVTIFERSTKGMVITPDVKFSSNTQKIFSARSMLLKTFSKTVRNAKNTFQFPFRERAIFPKHLRDFQSVLLMKMRSRYSTRKQIQ